MPRYFPVDTLTMKVQEARPFRRFTFSVVEMAVVTAIVLRVYRALVLSLAGSNVMLLGLSFAVGFVVLFWMVTLHLGNFTVRRWVWRAPLFAALEAGFESIVSLGLIALHREPLGSTRATFDDWPGIVLSIFTWRVGSIVVFALVLAAAVQLTRIALGEARPDVRHGTGENPA